MRRRTLLRAPLLAVALPVGAVLLAGCGEDEPVPTPDAPDGPGEGRHDYGEDPSQSGELSLPDPERWPRPRGTVVVIHGGFWRTGYDLSLGRPLAASLVEQGWVAWNLEYRRVGDGPGSGGGAPATFDDVAAGIDLLPTLDLPDGALDVVVTLGHSAGGHLATWAAGRQDHGWPGGVTVTHVVSQAGVLDLRASEAAGLGSGAAAALLGHEPTDADARFDPAQQLPLAVPVWCVHGRDDDIVPISQSAGYVEAATAAGATAELVEVDGDHFVVIDPTSAAWTSTLAVLDEIAPPAAG